MNVVKHANTDVACVAVGADDGRFYLAVEDDGSGFDVDHWSDSGAVGDGFGLFSIRDRLVHLGGSIEIRSDNGSGTRVTIELPGADE